MDVDETGPPKLVLELATVAPAPSLADEDKEGVAELVEIADCAWSSDCCCCFTPLFCAMVGNRSPKSKTKKKQKKIKRRQIPDTRYQRKLAPPKFLVEQ